ncbi:hypothetical protein GCM10012278_39580 [Nonomuraea glycinis]|uniref:Tetratricopeptide repeat protein n=1 Tax=Nonomuraea glycinis TaxID=2047744 RepID=A0A918A6F2_9ACTN|nr:hypothetical protein GCM10012278_39580 [Nonomuraea glycinis]
MSASPCREAIARLDLAIALADLGAPEDALSVGLRALDSPRIVAPVCTRATDLDHALAARYPGTSQAEEFHGRLTMLYQAMTLRDLISGQVGRP